ncbi:MAG: hypothetical protein J4G10_06060 [Alphaproteobacteria bacterium]|nr:hypothetical protein [Alphaproteobacteria bacterium]
MITAKDTQFHQPPDDDPSWAETNYFPFTIPEHAIQGAFYVLTRQNVGACISDTFIFQGHNVAPTDTLYSDNHAHLPCPERLEDYTLASGLSVKAVNAPMEYEVHYEGYGDTEFHLHFQGLVEPYDTSDPDMDPMTAQKADEHEHSWRKTAYKGHFDHTVRATGECKILGTPYQIDCVTTMDHSWGLRPEMDAQPMMWMHGHWGEDFAFHVILSFDPLNTDRIGPLLHGYIVENGEMHPLIAGKGVAKRNKFMAMEVELELKDVRGKTHSVRGESAASYVWRAWPGIAVYTSLLKWNDRNGKPGWGETQDCLSMKYVCQANKKLKNKKAAA